MTDRLGLDEIARTVTEVEGNLKDHLETAVVLESLGYTDEDARRLGCADTFALADAVRRAARPYASEEPLRETPRAQESGLRLYLAGTFYNVGWVIMLIALFLGGQSLWAARDIPVDVSTAIGLGVLAGLAVTGGVQQFAAWKLIYYRLQGNRPLARFVMRRSLAFGMALVLAAAAVIVLLAAFAIGLPPATAALAGVYLLLIGAVRLAATPMYAMRKFVAVVVVSLLALGVMFVAYPLLSAAGADRTIAVVLSQFFGLAALFVVSGALLHAFVFAEPEGERRPEDPPFYAKREEPRKVRPPKFWALAYDGLPYLMYGTLYFVFLFGDRLVSWFGSGLGPFALNYNRTYHVGVDLALLLLVPVTAVKFPAIYRLSEFLERASKRVRAVEGDAFRHQVARFHAALTVRVALAAVGVSAIAYAFAQPLVGLGGGDAASVAVFRSALPGIVLFSLFLSNAVFAMAFRRIGAMALLLLTGSAINFGLSATFAATMGANAAVFGFALASLFLAASSFAYVARVERSSAFAYYAAF